MTTEARSALGRAAPVCPPLSRYSLSAQRTVLAIGLVLTDALALAAAFRLAYWVRFELGVTVAPEVPADAAAYGAITVFLIPLWLVVFKLFSLYDPQSKVGGIVESSKAFNACTLATMLVVLATFVFPGFVVARMWVASLWLFSFLLVAANRFVARRVVYACRRHGYLVAPAAIVGTNEEARSLATFLSEWPTSGVLTRGFIATGSHGGDDAEALPIVGTVDQIEAIVEQQGIEELIVAITGLGREQLLELCERVDPLPVQLRLSSGLYELLTTRVTVQTLGTMPLMSVQKGRLHDGKALLKRALDLAVAGLVLAVAWPVILVSAIAIRLDSAGPILYRRRVLGEGGRTFDAFKLRTMYVDGDRRLAARPDASEALRANHKLRDDPRVTRVGRWLRRSSVDELPQLVNVLLGQMSLVGPRMITADETAKYGRHRLNLGSVKPGITGLWQVSGRSDLSYDERVRIDMYYVRNYSIWLDLQILFIETLPAVLKGRGAY